MFSTPEEVPDEIKNNKRYAGLTGYDIKSCAAAIKKDYGKVDILIHSLANGPEVTRPLLETSRPGYVGLPQRSGAGLDFKLNRRNLHSHSNLEKLPSLAHGHSPRGST
jgi:hypothetical protein